MFGNKKLLYILMYTIQYKFFFGFFQFFFKAAGSHCHNMTNSLSGRAIVVWGVDDEEMEDEG